jgi:uncharacterized protein (TIGR02246 family)
MLFDYWMHEADTREISMKPTNQRRIAPAIATALIWSQLAMGAEMQNHTDMPTIQAAAASWAEAFNRGDIDAIVAMYTDDAQLLPDGSEAIIGHTEIREFFRRMKGSNPIQTIRFSNFELFGTEPVITEHSEIEIRDKNGKVEVRGKQVLIRVKQNDQWKIHRDIWTNNGPTKAE